MTLQNRTNAFLIAEIESSDSASRAWFLRTEGSRSSDRRSPARCDSPVCSWSAGRERSASLVILPNSHSWADVRRLFLLSGHGSGVEGRSRHDDKDENRCLDGS